MIKRRSALATILFIISVAFFSARDVPPLKGPVNDYAGILAEADHQKLENYLLALDQQTGVQIAVLTIPSLEGDSLEAFSMQTVEQWKLGQEGTDNGALLLVALKDRAVRIETGYGLESTLTDAKSGLIIRNVMAPHFRAGRYGEGILEAVQNMAGIATGNQEIISESIKKPEKGTSGGSAAGFIFFIIFFLIMTGGLRRRGGLIGALFLGSMLGGGRSGGSGSGFTSGGFGGGFSGGGGGFGGGGASGGW